MSLHIHRTQSGEERWCFVCRKQRTFEYVVLSPVNEAMNWYWPTDQELIDHESYYGPTHQVECSVCHTMDSDMFPGGYREWSDE
jgi:hypothetical protein